MHTKELPDLPNCFSSCLSDPQKASGTCQFGHKHRCNDLGLLEQVSERERSPCISQGSAKLYLSTFLDAVPPCTWPDCC